MCSDMTVNLCTFLMMLNMSLWIFGELFIVLLMYNIYSCIFSKIFSAVFPFLFKVFYQIFIIDIVCLNFSIAFCT